MQPLTTIGYADSYFSTKLNVDYWTDSDDDTKKKLLYEATRRIYAVQGFKLTPEQVENMEAVPDDLQQACCEVVTVAADTEANTHLQNQKLGIASYSYNSESVSYNNNSTSSSSTDDYDLFSDYAKSLLNKYIQKAYRAV